MSEEAVKKTLNRIKKAIINHLKNADYQIIKSDNDTLCIIGARETEWRCIKGYTREIPMKEVKKLEEFPCPDARIIKKELWLKDTWENQFYKIFWNEEKKLWIDQFGEIINY